MKISGWIKLICKGLQPRDFNNHSALTIAMKTNLLSVFFLLSFWCHLPVGKSQHLVQGAVKDAGNQALTGASALLLQATDSSLVKGVICSSEGAFAFENVPIGRYLVACNLLGYDPVYSKPFEVNEKSGVTDLGSFTLKESATALEAVTVVAKRPFIEQKIDRVVVNVANSITNAGGNALEVLQRSPGVQVNTLTKTIGLLGKDGVVIMINGKVSRQPTDAVLQMLQGMNANNIDHIELIHTPPANFEAEGNAGIINIVLKSTGDEGLNGGYSLNGGYGRGEKYGGGAYFNYRHKRLNWFGNYDYNFNRNPQVFENYRGLNFNGDFLETTSISDRPYTPTPEQNARLGLDFELSKKTVIGVLGTFFDRDWYMEASNDIRYTRNGVVESQLKMPVIETNHSRSYTANVNLTHKIDDKQTLNLDADYVYYTIDNPSHYNIQNVDESGVITPSYELRIAKKTPIKALVAKLDYTYSFSEDSKLEAGGKITSLRFDNDVRVDSLPANQDWMTLSYLSSIYHLNEDVAGVYATYSTKLGPKMDIKAGLRYEYTMTNLGSDLEANIVDRKYGSLFPTLYLSRKITEKQNINLSYSRRITRPQIRWLAPWLIFSDPTTMEGGNPAVQASFTDALRLDYGLKSWKLGVEYNQENNPARFVPDVDQQTNRQVNRVANLGKQRMVIMSLFVPFHPFKWWDMQNNIFGAHSEIDLTLEGKDLTLSNQFIGFNSTQTFTLPKNWSMEVSGNFLSPGYWGVAKWKSTGQLNIGVQKDLGNKWGKLRLAAIDLFESSNWVGITDQPEVNLKVRQAFRQAERTYMLTWTNTFGNSKLKSARQRSTGSEEEMRRL